MASPFKIPKKKQPADGGGSERLTMQSPLSRLQDGAADLKRSWDPSRGGRPGAGSALGCRDSLSLKPHFRGVVRTLLGLRDGDGASAANQRTGRTLGPQSANHRADHVTKPPWNHQSQSGTPRQQPGRTATEPSTSCFTDRWRPKRASDRLLELNGNLERLSPPQKKSSSSEFSDSVVSVRSSSADSLDSLPAEEHAGSLSSTPPAEKTQRRGDTAEQDSPERDRRRSAEAPQNRSRWNQTSASASDPNSDSDDFVAPLRPRSRTPGDTHKHSSSSSSSSSLSCVLRTSISPRTKLDRSPLSRTSWLAASSNLKDQRERRAASRCLTPGHRLRTPKQTPSEPIVLSSEEEEGEGDEGDGEQRTSESCSRMEAKSLQPATQDEPAGGGGGGGSLPHLQELEFSSLHVGRTQADANGKITITESGIVIPLRGSRASGGEDGDVTVVASELRGYGVWDGGVARGGTLLADWEGPAPSLLFLWVTDAQANLLQRELTAIQPATPPGPSCCFLLLMLKEQLQELEATLLVSMLDSSSSSSSGLCSPLDWSDGLLLLHSAPPPLDQHLLDLLGRSAGTKAGQTRSYRSRKPHLHSSALQDLPSRLIQYPAAPCKGRITVSREDLACLDGGEFLNDVIIDFYLKYLLLEGVGGAVAQRCHVFSSFFYKQLSRRRAAGEEDAAAAVPDRHMRHQRVKTWTRHVDIFTKDFLFVPVNQEAHWYLVVICFPGLEESRYEEWQSPASVQDGGVKDRLQPPLEARRPRAASGCSSASHTSAGGAQRAGGKPARTLRSHQPPECTQQGWQKDTVLKRPCILVMDSLKLSYHENVCKLLRDYLHVEWEVRRGTPRLFTCDTMRSSSCRVPLQDNSSDCGLYLLQYTESFLQNPVVHFDLPVRLEHWFPRQQVWRKREEIRRLVMKMHDSQRNGEDDEGTGKTTKDTPDCYRGDQNRQ